MEIGPHSGPARTATIRATLHGETNATMGIMEAVQCAAEAMVLAASRYGLTVNFAAGKTEALVTMVGKKRQAAREDMTKLVKEREDGKCARISLRDGSGEKVRVVQFYKHLGSKTAAQPIMGPEIAGR